MTKLTDDTIDTYIIETINSLPDTFELKTNVSNRFNSLNNYIYTNKPKKLKFIDCINIYIFCISLFVELLQLDDITSINEEIGDIFNTINNYLYIKQYNSEKKYVPYEPDTKAYLNYIKNKENKTEENKNTISLKKNDEPPATTDNTLKLITVPKLDESILTEAKLLKTSGLTNSEIAKLIRNSTFNNVDTFPLENYSLNNQFVIRFRNNSTINTLSKINILSKPNIYNDEDLYKYFVNSDDTSVINKYYMLRVYQNNKFITVIQFYLNSIAHLEFKPGYLENLEKHITKPSVNSKRYLFTFGLLFPFKSSNDEFIGTGHRCALIFDIDKKKIYYFDTMVDTETYLSNGINFLYNSIEYACKYKLGTLPFIKKNKYTLRFISTELQQHDIKFRNIIQASIYHRYYKKNTKKPTFLDWGVGYCGTYVLLLLVLMSLNPYTELELILNMFSHIITTNSHKLLILMIRSFAYQLENIIYDRKEYIEIDKFDFDEYVKSGNTVIKLNDNKEIKIDISKSLEELKTKERQIFVRNSNEHLIAANKNPDIVKFYVYNISILFSTIGSIIRDINKIKTQMTEEQLKWIFNYYGPDDEIYFIKY